MWLQLSSVALRVVHQISAVDGMACDSTRHISTENRPYTQRETARACALHNTETVFALMLVRGRIAVDVQVELVRDVSHCSPVESDFLCEPVV